MALGTNVWFAERFGAFGVYRRNWSENQSENDPGKGKYLPLVPRQVLDLGLTYVDPSDLRISITESFVGERAADPQNTGTLSSYWVTGANLLWQILDRHLAFRLSVENLFDRRFETARGFPAPGRTVLTGLELRW